MPRLLIAETKKQTCILHNNSKPDNPSHVHDLPWDSISIILSGGYTEHRLQHIDLDSAIFPGPNPRMTTHVNGRPLAVAAAAVSGAKRTHIPKPGFTVYVFLAVRPIKVTGCSGV